MSTLEALKGSEEIILSHYGLPPITGNKHVTCPLCEKKKKFRLSRHNGSVSYICSCGNGSMINLIEQVTGQDFKTIAAQIDKIIGHSFEGAKPERPKDIPHETALKQFQGFAGIKGTPAQEYLNSRGIFSIPPKGVRYSGNTGMMSLVTDDRFMPCYWHETILKGSSKTNRLLKSLQDKNHLEYCGSVAIRMYPLASTLGIAEGVESALSARQIYQCSVWSVVNTSFMRRFKAPKGVEHLIIFADNDKSGAGHAAAFECAHKNILAKNDVTKVSVRWPGDVCDFNDMLQSGSNVFEWILEA